MEYHERRALELEYEEYVVALMESRRQDSIKKLTLYVDPKMAEIFSKILVSAYETGCPDAEEIIERLELNKLDFFAMSENFDGYKREYERDHQWSDEYE